MFSFGQTHLVRLRSYFLFVFSFLFWLFLWLLLLLLLIFHDFVFLFHFFFWLLKFLFERASKVHEIIQIIVILHRSWLGLFFRFTYNFVLFFDLLFRFLVFLFELSSNRIEVIHIIVIILHWSRLCLLFLFRRCYNLLRFFLRRRFLFFLSRGRLFC